MSVRVTGIKELNSAFRKLDSSLNKELRASFMSIADQVAGKVQQRMPFDSGAAVRSVKAGATQRGAYIAAGDTKSAPYYPWLDFGGSVGPGHIPGVAWSGSVKRSMPKGGRYLYPAIVDSKQLIEDAALDAIDDAALGAGFEVRG